MNSKNIIVIPCYNEAGRINSAVFVDDLKTHPHLSVLFVNDGSRDQTLDVLHELADLLPDQIEVLNMPENGGKAKAIYMGVRSALNKNPEYIGYIDADLAVSIEEFNNLLTIAREESKNFVFGSRWKRVGSQIDRKLTRHYIGRVFATIASNLLDLPVYDTQCGAKVMDAETARHLFKSPFNVNWVFDVEIFFRLLELFPKDHFANYVLEIPLKRWHDVAGSKVKFFDSFNVFGDFLTLRKLYKKKT